MIASYTEVLYSKFLSGCETDSRILDIGIGNGSALCRSEGLIKERNLHIVGVDICEDSLLECEENIRKNGLEGHVELVHGRELSEKDYEKFDKAFLSNSYSVIDEIGDVLNVAMDSTKDGQCVIALALFDKACRLKEFVKKNLKHILGFDCGRYITHSSLTDELDEMGLRVMTKELSCSNSVMGVNLANIYTLTIGNIER
jgi:cyclopropane fatty-acyl-phospholipid synthase-like methyltransferase